MKYARELTLFLVLVALMVAAAMLEPRFVTFRTQTLLAAHSWELALVAIPMLLIIIAGGIDLSVGAMVALSAVTLGLLHERGASPMLAASGGLAVGLACGLVNGWLIARTRVHPLLITLASMAAFRGIAEGISTARPISGYPEALLSLSAGWKPAVIFGVVAVAAHVLLTRLRWGRWIVAIGTDEKVSRFSKIPVDRVKLMLYSVCGLLCGLAGVLLVARNNTAKADLGMGMELEAITAVVLGGASIEGGKGRVLGLVLGLVLIHETRQFVSWHWRQSELNLLVIGGLLIVAVLFERFSSLRQRARGTTRA